MDADFSHDPSYLKTFLNSIQDCDVIVGSRFVQGGKDTDRGLWRQIVTILSSHIFRAILGLKVKDVGSGFKLYRREVLESLPWENLISSGIAISMEELFRIIKNGYRVKEVPIVFTDRRAGSSKLRLQDYIEPLKVSCHLAIKMGRAH